MMSAVNKYQTGQRQQLYVRALLNGDDEAAFQIIHQLMLAQRPLGDVYLNLITPALIDIGQLWCDGEIGVGLEKLASHLVLKHMDRLRGMHSSERPRLPQRILVACVEGELHCIGARMVADLLDIEGWSVDFLGADVPTPVIDRDNQNSTTALSGTLCQDVERSRSRAPCGRRTQDDGGCAKDSFGWAGNDTK